MKLIPLQNFIIIKPVRKEISKIILTHENADVPADDRGEVVALGEKVTLPIKEGQIVVFKPHLFEPLDKDDKNSNLIGREEAVIAIC